MSDDLVVRQFRQGNQLTLHVAGDLDVVSADQLAEHATSTDGVTHLQVDLTGVQFLDVRGAGGLERVTHAAVANGATVSIVGASDVHLRVLALVGLVDFTGPTCR